MNFELKKDECRLQLRAVLPGEVRQIEVHMISNRNRNVSTLSEVSPHAPQPHKLKDVPFIPNSQLLGACQTRELWFPVVDVALEDGMEAVAVFQNRDSVYCVNGMRYREIKPHGERIVIPAAQLEYWENSILIEPASPLESFYLRRRFATPSSQFSHTFKLLSPDWTGSVAVYAVTPDGPALLSTLTVAEKFAPAPGAAPAGLNREALLNSLKGSIDFTLRSQNNNPNSPFRGGLYLFYDLDASVYRTPHWIWSWGPSIRLLLDAAELPECAAGFGCERLVRVASAIGETALRFQIDDTQHPADGLVTSRWKPNSSHPYGYYENINSSDANFLAGWGWVPLYEKTGREEFLRAAVKLAEGTDRLMNAYTIIPQDYLPDLIAWNHLALPWTIHTLNESGFGVEGFAELYRVTGDERFRAMGEKYIEQHLAYFQRQDGLWERLWYRLENRALPCDFGTRGQAWPMEGILAAYRLSRNPKYLKIAEQMAGHFLKWQHPEGCWAFIFNRPFDEVGADEKGTPIWSYLLYQLYGYTQNPSHLEAARRALRWCVQNQYPGPDPEAAGGLVGCNPHSGVVYRPWFHTCCSYTSAFLGLAVLEELKLAK